MTIWEATLLGVVQGLTEFLPISSTAHLVVIRTWLGHEHAEDAFTTAIQLGTLFAVLAYFREDLWAIIAAVISDSRRGKLAASPESRLAWMIAVATIPVVVVGLKYKKVLKERFYDLPTMGVVAIVFALLMLAAELFARWRGRNKPAPITPLPEGDPDAPPGLAVARPETPRVRWWQAIAVGLWQALALMPGASRSGTTLTGGLFAGMTRTAAARFSFLLSIPSVGGAGLKDLYDEYKLLNAAAPERASLFASPDEVTALLVGTGVSAVVGYFAIAGLLRYLTRHSLGVFVGYRLLFGAVLLAGGRGGA